MEHRCSARVPVSYRVTLYRDKMPVAVCATKNISLGGLFVATGPLVYPKNTTLEVDIKLDTEQGAARYRLPACVVFHSQEGVGLMFLESSDEVLDNIRRTMRSGEAENTTLDIGLLTQSASG
ncbi:MAG: PilZ domain-containing protein [Gammaproteobacteria bacterium]